MLFQPETVCRFKAYSSTWLVPNVESRSLFSIFTSTANSQKKSENLDHEVNPQILPYKIPSIKFFKLHQYRWIAHPMVSLAMPSLGTLGQFGSYVFTSYSKKDPSLLRNDPQIFYCHHRMGARAIFMTLHLSQNCMSIISSALGPWTCLILINENITCC